MSKYIAFSTYCKEHKLSVPKDFNIEKDLLPKIPATEYKVAGYKFSEEILNKVVKEFDFPEVRTRVTKPSVLVLFKEKRSDLFIFGYTNNERKLHQEVNNAFSEFDLEFSSVWWKEDQPSDIIKSITNVLNLTGSEDDEPLNIQLTDYKVKGVVATTNLEFVNLITSEQY